MSVNRVVLVGYLGNEPETQTTKNGRTMTKFRLATTERYKDKSGDVKEDTQWHNIQTFGRTAEVAAQYLAKGHQVFLCGSLHTHRYTNPEGSKRTFTSVVVDELRLLDNRHRQQRREAA